MSGKRNSEDALSSPGGLSALGTEMRVNSQYEKTLFSEIIESNRNEVIWNNQITENQEIADIVVEIIESSNSEILDEERNEEVLVEENMEVSSNQGNDIQFDQTTNLDQGNSAHWGPDAGSSESRVV